ncbi:hypothetical protein CPB86DRAFT_708196 [Serendipita vermifera]|nr:hypothetical protein CPB86DRAFT_708196 [Serendipita vermifera]
MDIDYESRVTTNTFPTLYILSIANCSASLIAQILIKPLISSRTNLYIDTDDVPVDSLVPICYRRGDASSLWVNKDRISHIFSHGICVTELVLRTYFGPNLVLKLPAYIDCLPIKSLYVDGGETLTALELGTFLNLSHFEFKFEVSRFKAYKRVLKDTLNPKLPLSCPHLGFIGLILQTDSFESILRADGAEYAIEEFLKSWFEIHGKVFGTIRVQDGINPSRWEAKIPLLEKMLDSFELRDVMGYEGRPNFPLTHQFTNP